MADDHQNAIKATDVTVVLTDAQFFDAVCEGWLVPPGKPGAVLFGGVNGDAVCAPENPENPENADPHSIDVCVTFDATKIADRAFGEPVRMGGFEGAGDTASVVEIKHAVPVHAAASITVQTDENLARLNGMARHIGNVDFDGLAPIEVSDPGPVYRFEDGGRHCPRTLMSPVDRVRGAMAMTVWASSDEWDWVSNWEGLVETRGRTFLSVDDSDHVLAVLPIHETEAGGIGDADRALWRAAVEVLCEWTDLPKRARRDVCHAITRRATKNSRNDKLTVEVVEAWRDRAIEILRGAEAMDDLNDIPGELVCQGLLLYLARGVDAERYETWIEVMKDGAEIDGTAYAFGAALVGVQTGFRNLPTYYRGCPDAQQLQSVYAMRVCGDFGGDLDWPDLARWELNCRPRTRGRRDGGGPRP